MDIATSKNEDNAESSPLIRTEGITPAERYLKQLCDHTFLSLWSYPGVYRDQGVSTQGIGKEICDECVGNRGRRFRLPFGILFPCVL